MATANEVLTIARAELGTKESPRNSNNVKYNTWYYGRPVSGNYPWCMAFVQWCMHQAEITPVIRTASCGALMRAAIKAGEWVTGDDYKPGDVVTYDFPGGAATDHTGIIESFDGKYVTAIEGNTSTGNDSNGGEVMRRKRSLDVVVGAWRPKYEEDDDMTQEQFNKMMDTYLAQLAKQEPSDWSAGAREWAEETGLIKGDANGSKQYKGFVTREQLVVFMQRMKNLT